MIDRFESSQFESVRHLFDNIAKYQPMCNAVLEGVYPGKIFVDNHKNPRSALLTTFIESEQHGVWGFLVGEPRNKDFNSDLNRAIYNRQVISTETPLLLLTCDPDDWDGQMPAVLSPRPPIWMPRWHYVCRQVNYDWRKNLPEGFAVQRLHTDMLEDGALDLPIDVRTTLEKWAAAESELFSDYGFVTIDQSGSSPMITGWATVDFVAAGMGDLGFFTQPDYRRRGLGTIAAAAALEYGLANDLFQINWTCAAGNQGSIRTASRLGLVRVEDYQMAMLVFDQAEHMGTLGYYALQAKEFTKSAQAYEKAIELNPESPDFIYFEAAQAIAMTGEHQKAFVYLSESVRRGWKDVKQTQECEAFTNLRSYPKWESVIKEMEKTA